MSGLSVIREVQHYLQMGGVLTIGGASLHHLWVSRYPAHPQQQRDTPRRRQQRDASRHRPAPGGIRIGPRPLTDREKRLTLAKALICYYRFQSNPDLQELWQRIQEGSAIEANQADGKQPADDNDKQRQAKQLAIRIVEEINIYCRDNPSVLNNLSSLSTDIHKNDPIYAICDTLL